MALRLAFLTLFMASHVAGQQAGTQKKEDHLPLELSKCTDAGCTGAATSVTLDANWRWLHKTSGYSNCYAGSSWDTIACDTPEDCAKNCALEGVPRGDWANTYGVKSDGTSVTLGYVTGNNVGSRMYMLESASKYQVFKLLNREFTFDVDVSNLPCGLNGALYFVEMPADGGGSFAGNAAGAKYGTGYCDAQCPQDVKFINGEANTLDWNTTSAKGEYGSCCAEMDIWEANSQATAYTAHPCSLVGPKRCENEKDCGADGFCDRSGCDLNTYRFGNKKFFGKGPGFNVDTTKPFTIVTQFITDDNTDTGNLAEIRRFYMQGGKRINTPNLTVEQEAHDSITSGFCSAQKAETGDKDTFAARGGLKQMGAALKRGMVLTLSLWDDKATNMQWLDGVMPPGSSGPGTTRGPCDPSSGDPGTCRSKYPGSNVKYGNIRVGTLGSTTKFPPAPRPTPTPTPSPPPGPTPASGQCCHGGCTSSNCQGGWCGQSQSHCEGNCNGQWCPKTRLSNDFFV